jgi:hypothetical protein
MPATCKPHPETGFVYRVDTRNLNFYERYCTLQQLPRQVRDTEGLFGIQALAVSLDASRLTDLIAVLNRRQG